MGDGIGPIRDAAFMVNGGFFVLRPEIFDYIRDGEELVVEPFARLVAERKLLSYQYDGFWLSMDTFKDKMTFDHMYERGIAPWEVWKRAGRRRRPQRSVGGRRLRSSSMLPIRLGGREGVEERAMPGGALRRHRDRLRRNLLRLIEEHPGLSVHWVVFSATALRRRRGTARRRDGALRRCGAAHRHS